MSARTTTCPLAATVGGQCRPDWYTYQGAASCSLAPDTTTTSCSSATCEFTHVGKSWCSTMVVGRLALRYCSCQRACAPSPI